MARVLFICVHNSARSQMTEACIRKFGGEGFYAESAGLEPGRSTPASCAHSRRTASTSQARRRKGSWPRSALSKTGLRKSGLVSLLFFLKCDCCHAIIISVAGNLIDKPHEPASYSEMAGERGAGRPIEEGT